MGYLRTFYKTKMRIAPGGPIVDVRWYPCPPGAKLFPFRNHFYPLLWVTRFPNLATMRKPDPAPDEDPPGIGESQWAFTTIKGENTGFYKGLCFTGEPEWYRSGVPQSVIDSAMSTPPTFPPCCRDEAFLPCAPSNWVKPKVWIKLTNDFNCAVLDGVVFECPISFPFPGVPAWFGSKVVSGFTWSILMGAVCVGDSLRINISLNCPLGGEGGESFNFYTPAPSYPFFHPSIDFSPTSPCFAQCVLIRPQVFDSPPP